ncbi:MAG: hypothetical protein OER85_05370 [Gammaproteobacteria bacterium]|nr:hypothetical protein [Gammaproteobacteria bacterium]
MIATEYQLGKRYNVILFFICSPWYWGNQRRGCRNCADRTGSTTVVRRAAAGVFSLVGTSGMLFGIFVGEQLLDRFGYGAPITMMACLNAVTCLWAFIVRCGANQL